MEKIDVASANFEEALHSATKSAWGDLRGILAFATPLPDPVDTASR